MTHPFSVYLFLLRQTYLLAYLETVETFAINTDDGTLADKGGRIYLVDKTEYLLRLTLTRQYKQHVDILATVTAMTIHHRTTSVGGGIDGCTELQIFVADDEELNRTAQRIHHMIYTERLHKEADITVNHHLPIAQYQIRTGDDTQVANHDGMTQGNVPILVDHRRYGIRTTRRTIAGKTQTGTAAHEERTDDRCHERLVVKQRRHAYRMRLYQTGS